MRHVGIFHNTVFLRRFHIADRAQSAHIKPFCNVKIYVGLHFKIHHVNIDEIIFKLVQDIEIGVVHPVIFVLASVAIGSQYTAGIDGITERVYVERAGILSFYRVFHPVYRARGYLVPE
ncbi:hypothetical protein SDC9_111781 [bioreactor metagenome]|uniref:Uncharacterized protein n=1 Tax=bioreactor metagenome TaxID=1076179 RepID=A0A645BHE4_9ZZZZ